LLRTAKGSLRLEKHPDKTFIGWIERGFFDFLGYHFSQRGLTLVRETLRRFVSRATRLYEQEPGEPYNSSRSWVVCCRLASVAMGRAERFEDNSKFSIRCDRVAITPGAFS
jgi:hypothetical protein